MLLSSAVFYRLAALAVLTFHLLFILWVIFGGLVTRQRPFLRWVHLASVAYGTVIEIVPWPPCPLTVAEQWLQSRAGIQSYREPFLMHYLDALVYPDIPEAVLTWGAVAVGLFNVGLYVWRFRRRRMAGGW